MLMSQADLDELHERLIPLVVPPRNANGSVSKRKMKEVTVKVTDKSDDANSSGGNGKKKRDESRERSNSLANPAAEFYQKKIAVREAIRSYWKCETHTLGDRVVPCWRDGHTTQCYALTENDLNLWAELQLKNPTTVSIDKKPPQINLYNSARHSRSSQDRHQAPTMMPGLPGAGPVIPPMMGAPFFPGGFMNPWSAMMGHMGDMGHAALHTAGQAAGSSESAMGVNNGPQASVPSPNNSSPTSTTDIDYPDVGDWVAHCDTLPKRSRANLGALRERLLEQGFFEIDQLTRDNITISDLVSSLGVGTGIAALIIRYADEDVACVREGTFEMNTA
ncbi:hypothetical protein BJV77DRAFT_445117 [Russula vinacea]|nr:hypothetical protein BJV77DRAFT_445117 [Russula vinacea]